jgi:hypothetical protein
MIFELLIYHQLLYLHVGKSPPLLPGMESRRQAIWGQRGKIKDIPDKEIVLLVE